MVSAAAPTPGGAGADAAAKVDLKKALPGYQARQGRFEVLDLPPRRYLMVDGHGDPNTSPEFTPAVETLYPVSYALKFASKNELGRDYVVGPLEGLWTADDMEAFTTARDNGKWRWTLLVVVPDWIGAAMVEDVIDVVRTKKSPPAIDRLRHEVLKEDRCVQTLHLGSFDDEAPVLHELHHEFVPAHGLQLSGTHHEIYLSDFRRVAPDKRRTILRQPVAPRP